MLKKYLLKHLINWKIVINNWTKKHLSGFFVFNLTVLLMVLLSFAEYFKPFFPLSINTIVFLSLILSIFLLGVKEKSLIVIAVIFLVFSTFLKVVKIDIWAERASIYSYQAFVLGILILFIRCLPIYNGFSRKKFYGKN